MPPGGDGWYYFSAFLRGDDDQYGIFDVTLNDDVICSTVEDTSCSTGSNAGQEGCTFCTCTRIVPLQKATQ